jgi:hypothetical protein
MTSAAARDSKALARLAELCADSLLPGLALIVLLATIFYAPALFFGRTLAHGDIQSIDVPFFDLFARVVRGQASALWSSEIFGGHPLFAEGQAAFAHPLNIIWAAVVTPIVGPIYSMNLFYWMLNIFTALGVIGLCRCLGISRWASIFAALAVVFSSIWAHEHYVLPVHHTIAWFPWSLWAMEAWLKRPSLRSAGLFGAACALVFLAGYPQGLHGVIVYGCATLVVIPFFAELRNEWMATWRRRIVLGLIAAMLCLGLVSVQLLPSIELTELSHRAAGIDVTLAGVTPLTSYLRGVLTTAYTSDGSYFPGTGSILVCLLASVIVIAPAPPRVKAHAFAAVVLFLLGTERASPLFRFVYDHHLLPGLHFFRQMFIYLTLAAVGVAVTAAGAIDVIAKWDLTLSEAIALLRARRGDILLFLIVWVAAFLCLPLNRIVLDQIAFAATAVIVFAALMYVRKLHALAPLLSLLLALEIVTLRLHPFQFFDKSVLARPPSVDAIERLPRWQDYRFMTGSLAGVGAGLSPPLLPDLDKRIAKAYSAISPMSNLLWNIASLNGHLALPLERRTAIEDLLHDETFNVSKTPPGLRLIDLLAIRFVTNGGELATPAFRTIYLDRRPQIQTADNGEHSTQENTAAFPRYQIYTDDEVVDSLDAAVSAVRSLKTRTLVVEDPTHLLTRSSAAERGNGGAEQAASFQVVEAKDTAYEFKLSAAKPVWFFLADADYPGWLATIDGKDTHVFAAQVLGKAVLVPAGDHILKFMFRSRTFLIGLGISIVSVVLLIICCWMPFRTRFL